MLGFYSLTYNSRMFFHYLQRAVTQFCVGPRVSQIPSDVKNRCLFAILEVLPRLSILLGY